MGTYVYRILMKKTFFTLKRSIDLSYVYADKVSNSEFERHTLVFFWKWDAE